LFQTNQFSKTTDVIFFQNSSILETSFNLKIFSHLTHLHQEKYTLTFSSSAIPSNFVEANTKNLQLAYNTFYSNATNLKNFETTSNSLDAPKTIKATVDDLSTDIIEVTSVDQLKHRATYRMLPVPPIEESPPTQNQPKLFAPTQIQILPCFQQNS